MIDNVTLMRLFKPPKELYNACGKPFEYNGLVYSPKYLKGEVQRYEAQLKNLRLYLYSNKIYLVNSIHKFSRGNNHSDFHLQEMRDAIEAISEATSINWHKAIVKKIEYGCNISTNPGKTYRSLLSYRGKDYLPMNSKGKVYGAVCEFADYRMKAYDKAFQVQQVEAVRLNVPLFRWEISVNRMRGIEKKLNASPITVKELLKQGTWNTLANNAISIYQNTIKMQKLNLHLIKETGVKKAIAAMLVTEIREDLKIHNNATYKRDRRIFRRIMSDKIICEADNTIELLKAKFEQLSTH